MLKVARLAKQVAASASDMIVAAGDMTNGAQAQTREAMSVTTAMEELTRSVRQVAASAEDAEGITSRPQRLWVRAEYMTWWIKQANSPVLVTSGDVNDPAPGALNSLSARL